MGIKKFILFWFLIGSFIAWAQDDSEEKAVGEQVSTAELIEEQKQLDFEDYFLRALQQRSVENYDRAMEYLAKCESIFPSQKAVLFELAKNQYSLKQYDEALNYCQKMLQNHPDEFWVLSLKRDILVAQNNLTDAVVLQEKLYQKDRNEAEKLLRLYYRLKEYEKGKALVEEVDKKAIYVTNISYFEQFFTQKRNETKNEEALNNDENENSDSASEVQKTTEKSEELIQKLQKLDTAGDYQNLLMESQKALELYSTQAILYWFNGKSLNALRKFKEASMVLENGLDFVFDDDNLLKKFYTELVIANKELGNNAKANYYQTLVQKLN